MEPIEDVGFEVFALAGPFLFLGEDADAFFEVAEEDFVGAYLFELAEFELKFVKECEFESFACILGGAFE